MSDTTSSAELAQVVEALWIEVLRMPPGRADATFFDLQGQSIAAMRLVSRLRDEHGLDVDISLLFDDPDLPTFVREVVALHERRTA